MAVGSRKKMTSRMHGRSKQTGMFRIRAEKKNHLYDAGGRDYLWDYVAEALQKEEGMALREWERRRKDGGR